MKYQFSLLMALYAVVGSAYADGDIYRCVNPNGTVEYKNTGPVKGCSKVEVEGPTLIPAPAKHSASSGSSNLKSSSSANDFPKIDAGTQKTMDNDRYHILQDELKGEQDKLAALKKDYNNGQPERRSDERDFAKYQDRVTAMKDDISRTEKNIEALQRELKRNSDNGK